LGVKDTECHPRNTVADFSVTKKNVRKGSVNDNYKKKRRSTKGDRGGDALVIIMPGRWAVTSYGRRPSSAPKKKNKTTRPRGKKTKKGRMGTPLSHTVGGDSVRGEGTGHLSPTGIDRKSQNETVTS